MSEYEKLGVSASKHEVHAAVKKLPPSDVPNTFARVIRKGPTAAAMHVDTAGTKPALAYLYWKETGRITPWRWIAQDALVMNLDDLAATGFTGPFLVASNIARNKHQIPAEVLEAVISENQHYCEWLAQQGIGCRLAGGETADVGDVVRTIDVGITAYAETPIQHVLSVQIQPGDVIIGIASDGAFPTPHAPPYNSGIGSNGLTLARHAVLHADYARRYPETFAPQSPSHAVYRGSRKLTDPITVNRRPLIIGELLLAPTVTYLPALIPLFRHLRNRIHGIIHCTGGGQTKVLHFLQNVRVVKDNLFPIPPVFRLIQEEGAVPWREMFQVFNMGHRMEIYLPPEAADEALHILRQAGYRAQIVGSCRKADHPAVRIESSELGQTFDYERSSP